MSPDVGKFGAAQARAFEQTEAHLDTLAGEYDRVVRAAGVRAATKFSELALTASAWDEAKHPRQGKGSDRGGEFAPKSAGATVPTPSQDTLDDVYDRQLEVVSQSQRAYRHGLTPDEYLRQSGEWLQGQIAGEEVRIRAPIESVSGIIEQGFKTASDEELGWGRSGLEQTYFGSEESPVYGYVSGIPEDNGHAVTGYGEAVFRLKPEASARATVTLGDSANVLVDPARGGTDFAPSPFVSPAARSIDFQSADPLDGNTLRDYTGVYVEAQVWGGVDSDDIAEVVFTDGTEPDATTKQTLLDRGVPWRTVPSMDPVPLGPDKLPKVGEKYRHRTWLTDGAPTTLEVLEVTDDGYTIYRLPDDDPDTKRGDSNRAFLHMAGQEYPAITAAAGDPPWKVPAMDDLIDVTRVTQELLGATKATRTQAAINATRPILSAMGVSFSLEAPMVKDLVGRTGVRAAALSIPGLQDAVRAAITQAFEEGLSVPQTAALIASKTDGLATYQAEMLARTDLIGTANGGSMLAAKAVWPEQGTLLKRWTNATNSRTENDGHIRPTHLAANGQLVELDDRFLVGDDELLFPGDPGGTDAEVCNCRCVITYEEPATVATAWDEAKHPRHPKGEHEGGKFAAKAGGPARGYVPAKATPEQIAELRARFGADPRPFFSAPGDGGLLAIAQLQGFDGLPEVVSHEELMQRFPAWDEKGYKIREGDGSVELWRGVANGEDIAEAAKELAWVSETPLDLGTGEGRAEAFRNGPYYAGQGTWGNGTYTAQQSKVAVAYAAPRPQVDNHPQLVDIRDPYESPETHPAIVHMALRPEARVANGTALRAEWAAHMGVDNPNRGQVPATSAELGLDSDLGRYAAAEGYDAIDLDDGSGFFIVLNRTAVAVAEAPR